MLHWIDYPGSHLPPDLPRLGSMDYTGSHLSPGYAEARATALVDGSNRFSPVAWRARSGCHLPLAARSLPPQKKSGPLSGRFLLGGPRGGRRGAPRCAHPCGDTRARLGLLACAWRCTPSVGALARSFGARRPLQPPTCRCCAPRPSAGRACAVHCSRARALPSAGRLAARGCRAHAARYP